MPQLGQLENPISTFVEVVLRHSLCIPSTVANVNLFKEEIGWKGVVWGDIRPVQATVLGVIEVCLPPRFHSPPNQLWATTAGAPMPTNPSTFLQRLVALPARVSYMPRWAVR